MLISFSIFGKPQFPQVTTTRVLYLYRYCSISTDQIRETKTSLGTMSAEKFDGYGGFKALNVDSTPEDLRKLYVAWSETYDEEMLDDLKYGGPGPTADLLTKYLQSHGFSKDARILDFGCGSGMVAEELRKRGYTNIDGVDLCVELMAKAKEKDLYKSLIQGEMASEGCEKLNVAANQYDAATCVGVLTYGHVKSKGFDDFVHALKPGGLACFTVRRLVWDDPAYGYATKMDKLCEEKKWKLLEKKYIENYTVDDGCWLCCCQIL